MNANTCAPTRYDKENDTCFTMEQLLEMAAAYNRYLTKSKLNPNKTQNFGDANLINIKKDKKYLLLELVKRFEKVCDGDQYCLTQQSFMNEIVKEMREDIINNTFRSYGPDDPKEWLSTTDINNIMMQYENIYKKFKFFGAVPLNCNELSFCSLYKLDFDNYYKNDVHQVAVVFNLDKYGKPGSHWVALYIDIAKGEIYFCDSNGKQPTENIAHIINQFIEFHKKRTGKNAIFKYNNIPYQKDSSECGVYSCNFIIRKLAGETFDDIINNPLSFQDINSCRNIYFRNKPSKFNPHSKCDPHIKLK
ncbi:putative thiol protease [Tupanvirus soda lake]|uniref:Thiol protease n=2 Tax=Tupanvirus TaxID=2094720 RepID=A0AC62ABU1_9VIRU|nr:putative thiol protease [Tupanvirus soda lake]QKU35133.1 putative thiol protease [Tupanvirus soda lake]